MRCIAHRGFAGLYPENTLTAVRQAAAQADMIEVDVRRCASGELVVFHDETVDRLTDETGAVAEYTAAELADMDIDGSGEGVPELSAVLEAVPPDVGLDLELKESGLIEDVREAVKGADVDVWLSSFDTDVVARATETTDVPVVLIVDDASEAAIERAAGLGCAGIAPHWRLIDFALIERAHRSDLAVYAWPINDIDRAASLQKMDVDGIVAEEPTACTGD
ncbi:glycerophosphoryl diester phosphodiesterase [Halorhabdus utahensis DSM 12940]|uniref:Glycerophosphoryl diester phosphodiesterase n=1 Tax=Halorhabdus utahensis (strain DSM 12940 / JCM 11049 / AX-2) TaxID=519442 RepID=C7NS24_HALUD|nr:glycerophosphodiester phosphodiesterase [Halorhabdus utahensis]ACV10631.1 glycerophosphoryl diester phosphodiesterase [Halorhabdus utahensis DSM 12940]